MPAVPLGRFAIHLRPVDNVAVAARTVPAGVELTTEGGTVLVPRQIGLGHKFALEDVAAGQPILKYGQVIGFARKAIVAGEHVHVHNVSADAFERDYAFCQDCPPPPRLGPPRTFLGYDRGDGRYGTRNFIAVLSTVNCSASTSKYIAERIRSEGLLRDYPQVDGIVPITHKAGCAIQFDGPDHRQLDRTLAGFARHPNVAACVIVGLGCETASAAHLIDKQDLLHSRESRQRGGC